MLSCPRWEHATTLIHVKTACFHCSSGTQISGVPTLPHLTLQVKEHEGSSKERCVFIQQELLTCFIFFLHVSSHKQMSQPPGTSRSFNSSSALFVQHPCSHTLNSSLHRDKLSMLSLVMLQGAGADSPGTRRTVHERDKIATLQLLVLVPLCFNRTTCF